MNKTPAPACDEAESAHRAVSELVPVRLLDAPVQLWISAIEWQQDLMREFALLRIGHESGHSVPGRLLTLVGELSGRYGRFTQDQNTARDSAHEAGLERMDVAYEVPVEAAEACLRLSRLLEEVDEYCRAGDLLTLQAPPEILAFRRWYLGQFIAQIQGDTATPWGGPWACRQ